jgi:NAD(P)-dependent dehydrogenase (short-subunit alcohol dehydrogenase family)
VNNAGALFDERREVDGVEATMALNYVAAFLLTAELMAPLRAAGLATGDARVVNVSSSAHEAPVPYTPDDLRLERAWSPFGAYAQSKLADVLFTYALARRMAGTGVTANALHPGVIASGFGAASGGVFALGFQLMRPFMSSPEKGARTSVYLASDPAIRGATGGYYKKERPARSSARSRDVAAQEALWAATERAVSGGAGA